MSSDSTNRERQVAFGQVVYDADGNELGRVRGMDEHGFYVTATESVTGVERQAGSRTGEKYLMWRCWECGETGQIKDIPDRCPSCGAGKEEIYYWTED